MKLPVVMPSNLTYMAESLNKAFPGRAALLLGPSVWANPKDIPFASDNDRFSCWSKNKIWSKEKFESHLERILNQSTKPLWIVVPDIVANAQETFKEYRYWHKPLSRLSIPLALAVQDGMIPRDVTNRFSC